MPRSLTSRAIKPTESIQKKLLSFGSLSSTSSTNPFPCGLFMVFIISVFDTTISDVRHSGLCHSDDRIGKESPCHSERSEESPPIFVISSVIPGKCEESLCHSGAIQVKIGGSGNEIFSSSQKSRKESSDDNVYTVLLLVRYTRKAVRRKKLGFPSMKTRTSFPASSSCFNRS